MSGHIYILTDGINSKIGITISLDKRLSSYTTHNPNFYTYKVYDCPIKDAKKIEAVIKLWLKDRLSGTSKEWFSVQPNEIDRIVVALLEPITEEVVTPAMHEVIPSEEVYELKEKILQALAKHKGLNSQESHEQKNKLAELFSSTFKLGIPEHRLPKNIVLKEGLSVDIYHCNKESYAATEVIRRGNSTRLPYDDHTCNFYHLVKLNSGSYIAICTSRASMPFRRAVASKKAEILEAASNFGLYAFYHDDWSWYEPDESGLILYTQKTPVKKRLNLWESSFRKWVIERSKLLEQETFDSLEDYETLAETIDYICSDATFPLHVKSVEELYKEYLMPYLGWRWEDEDSDFMMEPDFTTDSYKVLFEKWNEVY